MSKSHRSIGHGRLRGGCVILLTACALLGACSDEKPKVNTARPANIGIRHDYPKDAVDVFLRACESESHGQPAYCRCVLDKVQRKYTYEEFSKAAQQRMKNEEIEKYAAFAEGVKAECTAQGDQ